MMKRKVLKMVITNMNGDKIEITEKYKKKIDNAIKLNNENQKKIHSQLYEDAERTNRLTELFNEIEKHKIELMPNDFNGEYMKKFMPAQFIKYYINK